MSMSIPDKRLGLMMLLVKLRVIGASRRRYSMVTASLPNFTPPPCSIQLAIVSTYLEFIEFVPLSKKDEP